MRSKVSNDAFRAAAQRLYGFREDGASGRQMHIPQHGNVERPASGGAYVDAQVWVPEEEAAKEEK